MLNKTSYASNVWWLRLRFSVGTSLQYAVEHSNSVQDALFFGMQICQYILNRYIVQIISVAEWLRLSPLNQQVDIEDLGSYIPDRQARLRIPIVGQMSI